MGSKRVKYTKDIPRRMYTYFTAYSDGGAPSFSKFARACGITLADISSFRKRREFERAYTECNEIRRDYLIDKALKKENDSSMTKFILNSEYGMGDEQVTEDDKRLNVILEVLDE